MDCNKSNDDSLSFRQTNKLLIILLSIVLRWSVSLYSYSGQSKPVMFGDYEAQRHWMEITYNLNATDWYVNTADNNLSYWGLDYPPLTAYHSYLMGYVGNKINRKFVALHESRGIESDEHKLFMRITVLLADLLIFYPSVVLIVNKLFKANSRANLASLALVLLNPTLILIDHGHFQYNCASLGLMQLAVFFLIKYEPKSTSSSSFAAINLSVGSFFFCLALNYKQMELYHALPFFFYLLSLCVFEKSFIIGFLKLTLIGLTVILTFAFLWLPFLTDLNLTLQVLNRLFPFSRGLFEDKVANFWCSVSIVLKLKQKLTIESLSKLSLATTAALNLPSMLNLFLKPSQHRFMLALVNSALVFFLFSFQVHEKSILLATIPACLLINSYPMIISWFILISNFSMLPLLYKDGLSLAFLSLSLIYLLIVHKYYDSSSSEFWPTVEYLPLNLRAKFQILIKLTYYVSLIGIVLLSACFMFARAPARLPDLWTVLICAYCCIHFIGFSVLFHMIQFSVLDSSSSSSLSSRRTKLETTKKNE